MGSPITTGSHPKALVPGIKAWHGVGYGKHPEEYLDLFDIQKSTKAFEEMVQQNGFPLFSVKNQAQSLSYSGQTQGPVSRFTNIAYFNGYIVTREERADNQYPEVTKARATSLGFAKKQTKENLAAAVYNRAHTSGYTGGDGSILCVTSHASAVGSQSNCLATAADMSESALEDMWLIAAKMTDYNGLKISLQTQSFIVPPDLYMDALRITKSVLASENSNNAINAIRVSGMFPDGIKVNHFLSDTDSCFIRTNCPNSMIGFDRDDYGIEVTDDFDTKNLKVSDGFRMCFGWADWRGVVSNAGGA